MIRAFRVAPGRTVTLPQGLRAGPGQTNMRLEEGAVVTLDLVGDAAQFTRFVNGRRNAGDWDEIKPEDVPPELDGAGAAVRHVPDPNRAGDGVMGLSMPKPTSPGALATRKGR
ncbi:MAG TPA: hypothetical protein VN253_30260 [Kofleriaceae bacterium]|nr:hypothetical protein [Kofleriaceae bacterium]